MTDAKTGPGAAKIVVATADTLSAKMAGPAIRAWQIAAHLATEHDVRLVTTSTCDVSGDGFVASAAGAGDLAEHAAWCEVVVAQGNVLHEHPVLAGPGHVVVADMYDPAHLEQLEQAKDKGDLRPHVVHASRAIINGQLLRGDFLLCASERQRDFWLGALASLGRVNTAVYDADPSLRSLVDTVPFGLPGEPPRRTRAAVKGVLPGIGAGDELLLWGGGVYNWFDPLTLIRAVDWLRSDRPAVRLLFLGMRHPNPKVPEMGMASAARALSADLGLTGTHVFFNEEWVDYADRQNYLLDADVGVSTHLDHVETQLSFRTRVLDYLWAGLPVVTTAGDALADLVSARGLGVAVPAGDVDALAAALGRVLGDVAFRDECRANVAALAPEFAWPVVLAPLLAFCRAPRRAPDLVAAGVARTIGGDVARVPRNPTSAKTDASLARSYLQEGGAGLLLRKIGSRLANRARGR